MDRPGAQIDVACPEAVREEFRAAWVEEARAILTAVGWGSHPVVTREMAGGLALMMSAPIDALYAACDVNEAAFDAARARITGEAPPDREEVAASLRALIAGETNPPLLRLRDEAARRGVPFLPDADEVSLGLGARSRTFAADGLPAPEDVDWDSLGEVPVVLVTGTNGKSTTVRLLASIAKAAGKVAGTSSTDGVVVDGEMVEAGDYSGPEGARRVLRDPRVEIAILETARGGLLRRGLAVPRADVALVTNVAEDHLGDGMIGDLDTLAEIKLTVARAVKDGGLLVLNGEDRMLRRHAPDDGTEIRWFGPGEGDRTAVWLADLVPIDEIPITYGGAARHNVANALAAAVAAEALGFDRESIGAGLRSFGGGPEENPGRGNRFDLGGATAILDYAHNPEGYRALIGMIGAIPARRRLIILGQAGDRTDQAIGDLVRMAWTSRPDRVVVKEMESLLRGREKGEVPSVIVTELRRLGMPADGIVRAPTELHAVKEALAWAREGDLLLLLCHSERPAALALLQELTEKGWRPGDPLPA
jgi:UDP-N-acetylmuramyl tripeptide synthase